ncbi:MAG: hypothetical protein K5656_08075 [Lachnospiraceae bacterium]|nr:hypothetical protein [Lachnospiraceae bacterium]
MKEIEENNQHVNNKHNEEMSYAQNLDNIIKSKALELDSIFAIYGPEGKLPERFQGKAEYDSIIIPELQIDGMSDEDKKKLTTAIIYGSIIRPENIYNAKTVSSTGNYKYFNQMFLIDNVINGEKEKNRIGNYPQIMLAGKKYAVEVINELNNGDQEKAKEVLSNFAEYAYAISRGKAIFNPSSNRDARSIYSPYNGYFRLASTVLNNTAIKIKTDKKDVTDIDRYRMKVSQKSYDSRDRAFILKKDLLDCKTSVNSEDREELVLDFILEQMIASISQVSNAVILATCRHEFEDIADKILYGEDDQELKKIVFDHIDNYYARVLDDAAKYLLTDIEFILSKENGKDEFKRLYSDSIKNSSVYKSLISADANSIEKLLKESDRSIEELNLNIYKKLDLTDVNIAVNNKYEAKFNKTMKDCENLALESLNSALKDENKGLKLQEYSVNNLSPSEFKKNYKVISNSYEGILAVDDSFIRSSSYFRNMKNKLEELTDYAKILADSGRSPVREELKKYKNLLKEVDSLALDYLKNKTDTSSEYAALRYREVVKLRQVLDANLEGLEYAYNAKKSDLEADYNEKAIRLKSYIISEKEGRDVYNLSGEFSPFLNGNYDLEHLRKISPTVINYSISRTAGVSLAVLAFANIRKEDGSLKYSIDDIMAPTKYQDSKQEEFKNIVELFENFNLNPAEAQKKIAEIIYNGFKAITSQLDAYFNKLEFPNDEDTENLFDSSKKSRADFRKFISLCYTLFDMSQEWEHCTNEIFELAKKDNPEFKDEKDVKDYYFKKIGPIIGVQTTVDSMTQSNTLGNPLGIKQELRLSYIGSYIKESLVQKMLKNAKATNTPYTQIIDDYYYFRTNCISQIDPKYFSYMEDDIYDDVAIMMAEGIFAKDVDLEVKYDDKLRVYNYAVKGIPTKEQIKKHIEYSNIPNEVLKSEGDLLSVSLSKKMVSETNNDKARYISKAAYATRILTELVSKNSKFLAEDRITAKDCIRDIIAYNCIDQFIKAGYKGDELDKIVKTVIEDLDEFKTATDYIGLGSVCPIIYEDKVKQIVKAADKAIEAKIIETEMPYKRYDDADSLIYDSATLVTSAIIKQLGKLPLNPATNKSYSFDEYRKKLVNTPAFANSIRYTENIAKTVKHYLNLSKDKYKVEQMLFELDSELDSYEEIYAGLTTIKEKVEFLIKSELEVNIFKEMNETLYKESDDSFAIKRFEERVNTILALMKRFVSEYLQPYNDENYEQMSIVVGELLAEAVDNSANEKETILSTIPLDDPYREDKANYLSNKTPNRRMVSLIHSFSVEIGYSLEDNGNLYFNKYVDSIINEKTTLREYAKILGVKTEDELNKFIKNKNLEIQHKNKLVNADTSFYTLTKIRNQGHLATRSDDFIKDKTKVANATGFGKYLERKNYSNDEIERLKDLSYHYRGEILLSNNIDAWIESDETKAREYAMVMADSKSFIKSHDRALKSKLDEIKNKDFRLAEEKRRFKKPTFESHPWLMADDKKEVKVKKDQADIFMKETGLDISIITVCPEIVDRFIKEKNYLRYQKATRPDRANSLFMVWAIANYDDLNIANIDKVADDSAMIEAFAKFCEDNPTMVTDDKGIYKTAASNWVNIFAKATDRIKAFKLPEIDYSNIEELKKNMLPLMVLSNIAIDFNQEKDHVFGNVNLGIDGKAGPEFICGQEKWDGIVGFWDNIQNLMSGFSSAYRKEKGVNTAVEGKTTSYITAFARLHFEENFKNAGGLSVDELVNSLDDMSLTGEDYLSMSSDLTDFKSAKDLDIKTVVKYLNGKDKSSFKKKSQALRKEMLKESVTNTEQRTIDPIQEFAKYTRLDDIKSELAGLNSSTDIIEYVSDTNSIHQYRNKKYSGAYYVNVVLNELITDDYRQIIRKAGFTYLDLFTVDGKSVKELMADKYSEDLDEMTRDSCYKLELLKAISSGESEVKIKTIKYDNNGKLVEGPAIAVSDKANRVQKIKYNLPVYNALIEASVLRLKEFKNELAKTHPNYNEGKHQEALEEMGEVGSSYFNDLEKRLNACIKALENRTLLKKDVKKAIFNLQKAADSYYKKRNSIFGKHSDHGQKRLDLSGEIKTFSIDLMAEYEVVRFAMNSNFPCEKGVTSKDASISSISSTINMLENRSKYTYGLDKANATEDNIKDSLNQQKSVIQAIMTQLTALGKDFDSLFNPTNKLEVYDAALSYCIKKTISRMQESDNILNPPNHLPEIETETINKAKKLSENPLFIDFIASNDQFDFETWDNIENACDAAISKWTEELSAINNKEGGKGNYILNEINSINNDSYDRLGDYVAKQLLVNPKYRNLVLSIELSKNSYDDFKDETVKVLREKNVLNNKNPKEVSDKLDNADYEKMVTSSLTASLHSKDSKKIAGKLSNDIKAVNSNAMRK